jgi:hypothetical protein
MSISGGRQMSESTKVEKPWGSYETIYGDENTQVKIIRITPMQRPSYQYHFKRTETWVVVKGTGTLTLDDKTSLIKKGDVIFVPKEAKHRVQNTGTEDLIFVEVQMGEYFGEDDIVRVSDDYSRESTR